MTGTPRMPRSVFLVEGICADGVGDVDVTDAIVGLAGVIRMVVSPSSMAMKMPRYHLSRPARNARLFIRSLQPIDIDFLRPRFAICFPILFSYPKLVQESWISCLLVTSSVQES